MININTLNDQDYQNLEDTDKQLVDWVRQTLEEINDIKEIEENGWEAKVKSPALQEILQKKSLESLKDFFEETQMEINGIVDINLNNWICSQDHYNVTGYRDMIKKSYDGFMVWIGIGGPGYYIDTQECEIHGKWGSSNFFGIFDPEIAATFDDTLVSLYDN